MYSPEKTYQATSQVRAQKLQSPVSDTTSFLSAAMLTSSLVSPCSWSDMSTS